mgnify:CR=1 FL=1
MSNNTNVYHFPNNELQALAYLYLKNQDLSDKSPTEIYDIFINAYIELTNAKKTKKSEKYQHN